MRRAHIDEIDYACFVFICVLRYDTLTFFSQCSLLTHLPRAIVYLLSVALRSQDVKLNDVSCDHYLINEPPSLEVRGSTKINHCPS